MIKIILIFELVFKKLINWLIYLLELNSFIGKTPTFAHFEIFIFSN